MMPSFLRSITKRVFIIFTLIVTVLFLLSCTAWYLEPGKYWYIALLGVGFAFLGFAVLTMFIFWVVFRSRWFILPLSALILGWQPINAFFAFHPLASKKNEKGEGNIRIMQWNVSRFDEMSSRPGSGKSKRKDILNYISRMQPDIICMQEFLESNNVKMLNANIPYFRDSLGYKYFSYAMDHRRRDSAYEHGVAIFSKYPIRNTQRRKFGGPKSQKADESYIYADIDVNGQMIRVFTTHLQSLLFTRTEFQKVEEIKRGEDGMVSKSMDIFSKFRQAYMFREQQAEKIRQQLDNCPYPEIICGDFNDVPNSFVYNCIKGDRKDAFTVKGFGIGRTFSSLSPTLRIDYIMTDKQFKVDRCLNPHPRLSDHFPVIADIHLENPE